MAFSLAGHRVRQGAERQRPLGGPAQVLGNQAWCVLVSRSRTLPTLTRSATDFIRGLLDNVGAEIDPIRLIRRIKNGLEIPGLKRALIKILQDFNLQVPSFSRVLSVRRSTVALQISLMEGCKTILYSDCRLLALSLHDGQTNGFLWTGEIPALLSASPS